MKAKILGFRRGKKTYTPRHFILEFEQAKDRKEAKSLEGKKVLWKSPSGKKIKGMVSVPHGIKGHVRAIFEKGLPGQAINDEVEVE